ncbi:integrase family protein [Sphingobium chlorophenolicum L-1]|uniref:Integrase family protein n=2 Tax=Sphingobium chlorophenolicum TaxID=46429 RepID=F6EVA7_SPHCR|nr:integrase family protein [Sphingobium chlorophenolicum L-1]
MSVGRITTRAVEKIPRPENGRRTYLWDSKLTGFGVMVTHTGARSYLVQYQMGGRGFPTKRVTIGRHGAPWTAEAARNHAADLLQMVRTGLDPVEENKRRQAEALSQRETAELLAFDRYVERFSEKYLDANNLRSADDIKSVFRRDLTPVFKSRSISSLRRSEIADCLDNISGRSKSASIKAHKWLRKLLSWAVDRGDLPTSPMESMPPPHKDGQRSRVLRGEELRVVWFASEAMGEPYASFIKLMVLTGQRLREVAGIRRSEIDLAAQEWIIPASRTKNGRDHLCRLSPQAAALLRDRFSDCESDDGFAFTTHGTTPIAGFSKLKARLDASIARILGENPAEFGQLKALDHWVFHDLRRSFGTGCQTLGFPIEHTEACLNHVSGKRGGLAAIYQLHDYKSEKAAIFDAWGDYVGRLTNEPMPNKA